MKSLPSCKYVNALGRSYLKADYSQKQTQYRDNELCPNLLPWPSKPRGTKWVLGPPNGLALKLVFKNSTTTHPWPFFNNPHITFSHVLNPSELAKSLPLEVNPHTMDSAHTKANLLLQCHFGRVPLPSTDYNTDTKSVLDQAIRICQVRWYF